MTDAPRTDGPRDLAAGGVVLFVPVPSRARSVLAPRRCLPPPKRRPQRGPKGTEQASLSLCLSLAFASLRARIAAVWGRGASSAPGLPSLARKRGPRATCCSLSAPLSQSSRRLLPGSMKGPGPRWPPAHACALKGRDLEELLLSSCCFSCFRRPAIPTLWTGGYLRQTRTRSPSWYRSSSWLFQPLTPSTRPAAPTTMASCRVLCFS